MRVLRLRGTWLSSEQVCCALPTRCRSLLRDLTQGWQGLAQPGTQCVEDTVEGKVHWAKSFHTSLPHKSPLILFQWFPPMACYSQSSLGHSEFAFVEMQKLKYMQLRFRHVWGTLVLGIRVGSRDSWAVFLSLPLSCWVISAQSLNFSVSPFPQL